MAQCCAGINLWNDAVHQASQAQKELSGVCVAICIQDWEGLKRR